MTQNVRLEEALKLAGQGAVVKAMQILYDMHEKDPGAIEVLAKLVGFNLHLNLIDGAIVNLHKLIKLEPTRSSHYDQLAAIYSRAGEWQQACETYYGLILHRPTSPEAHFNLAYYLRKDGRFQDAIDQYKSALKHGIAKPEEVHLNIAVILADDLRREEEAKSQLLEALAINDAYLPALNNLANLCEDRGDLDRAAEILERMLSIEPGNAKALSRLAALPGMARKQYELLARLEAASESGDTSLGDRIDCLYSLGKIYNDREDYEAAFKNYVKANQLNAREMPPYDQAAAESYFNEIIQTVSAEWVKRNTRAGEESPVFICGMFRSGSTLVEQILASHRDITAGGERDTFVREFSKPRLGGYPASLDRRGTRALHELAKNYLAQSATLFPGAKYLTDKRPDNFQYIGLIKALFPRAKIIYTVRDPLDNCLSVYFVRFAQAMNYSVSLKNIAHYRDQQARLFGHWRVLFGDDIHVVNYDDLVNDPRRRVEGILDYLGLEWDETCLEFHQLKNTVKTASAWQVRQPLYSDSSGRWKNFEKYVGGLLSHYQSANGEDSNE